MANVGRPSLDVLVPLVMIDNDSSDDISVNSRSESQNEILRYFESGDIVLIRLDVNCSPAIVFNASGLVMKFDIDRQLYHVCLLNNQLTEQWVDANDMIIYSVPMIADCNDDETMLMWSTANELLAIPNSTETKARLEEFQRRFYELKQQRNSVSSERISNKNQKDSAPPQHEKTSQIMSLTLTTCEELVIIESIHRSSLSSFMETKRIAEETYQRIIYINNRENVPLSHIKIIPAQWFITFLVRHIQHFRRYSNAWLANLEATSSCMEIDTDLSSLISLLKESA